MKKLSFLIGTLILSAGLAGCSSAYYASSGTANDDLYALHDKTSIARKQQAKAEAEKAAAEARRAAWEARIAEAQAAAAENEYYEYNSNPYQDILADDYESAYARRLRGFESPTYKMPSSYYNFRYGSAFTYATAYDPAFYNIIISGDQVWVEPKYVTSMFGTWGGSPYGGWYFGWNYSPSWWGYPSYAWGGMNWGFGVSWYDPWWGWGHPYWGPGWRPGWGGGWHGGHHWAYRPHNYRLDGGGRTSRYVPGSVASGSRYRGTNSSGYRNGTTVSRGGNTGSGRTYYQSGGRNNRNNSVYNNSNSNRNNRNNNNSWNSNRNDSYRNNNSGRSSYDSGSRSSNSSSFGGSRGGSSGGGYSGGGGSRGGSSAGGSRGYGGR